MKNYAPAQINFRAAYLQKDGIAAELTGKGNTDSHIRTLGALSLCAGYR
jgi:hypothetical protein